MTLVTRVRFATIALCFSWFLVPAKAEGGGMTWHHIQGPGRYKEESFKGLDRHHRDGGFYRHQILWKGPAELDRVEIDLSGWPWALESAIMCLPRAHDGCCSERFRAESE